MSRAARHACVTVPLPTYPPTPHPPSIHTHLDSEQPACARVGEDLDVLCEVGAPVPAVAVGEVAEHGREARPWPCQLGGLRGSATWLGDRVGAGGRAGRRAGLGFGLRLGV